MDLKDDITFSEQSDFRYLYIAGLSLGWFRSLFRLGHNPT